MVYLLKILMNSFSSLKYYVEVMIHFQCSNIKAIPSNIKGKCIKMVHEYWRPCNHNMGLDEIEISAQISRLLPNKRKKRGTIQDDTERG
jgi:hypothetical protein